MSNRRKLMLDFFGDNRGLVLAAFLTALLSNLLNVLLPLSIGKFYEIVLHDTGSIKGKMFDVLPFEINDAGAFFIFFGIIIVMKGIIGFLEKFLASMASERFSRDLRELAFASQLNHPMNLHQRRTVGKYLQRYSGDMRSIQNFVSKGILAFTGDVFFIAITVTVLGLIQPRLTVVFVLVITVLGGIIIFLGRKLHEASLERGRVRSKTLDFVSSRLLAFYTIKSFNRETLEKNSFRKKSARQYDSSIQYNSLSALIQALLPVFFFGTLALVLMAVAQDPSHNGGGRHGNIFFFVLLMLYMQSVIKRLLKVNLVWQAGKTSMNKLIDLLETPAEPRTESSLISELKGRLTFKDVSFSYENGKQVLSNSSFEILPDNITLIKGKQGSGKSTLLKLVQKLYEPQSGEIFLDRHSFKDLSAFEIRKEVAIVSAETPLLGSTVFKAIAYKSESEKREDAINVLEQLNFKLGDNAEATLDFKLEEQGKNISAGQRIMLQFARAFLTRKKILLLDEPFQHLDDESKKIIAERLSKLKSRRTIMLISDKVPDGLVINQIVQL